MTKRLLLTGMVVLVIVLAFSVNTAFSEKKMPDTVTIKIDEAKMAPVTFSHITHTQKAKIDCAVCHHKDKNPKEPQACPTCHLVKEVKNNAPMTKDAFHKRCQTCHKENAAKGASAPTKCTECHKK